MYLLTSFSFSKIFYFSHLLYVLYWILLIFHSPNFWIWFIAPCSIFLLEKIYRIAKTFSEKGKTQTKLGLILASKVVHLVIKRPKNFKFKAKLYIPGIINFEKRCSPKPFWQTKNGLVSGKVAFTSIKTEILNKIGI